MTNKILTVLVVLALLLTCTLAAGATNVIVGSPSVVPDIPWWCRMTCNGICQGTDSRDELIQCFDDCVCSVCGI